MTFFASERWLWSFRTAASQRSIALRLSRAHEVSPTIGAGPSQIDWLAWVPFSRSSRARTAKAR